MGNGKCHCTYNIINNTSFLNKKIFIDIAKVLQEQIRNINELISCNLNAYLIPTKSLPVFISLIKKYKILDNLNVDPNEIIDLNTTEEFPEFELNKELEIISSFSQCKKYIEKNKAQGNEFIIVNKKFIELMRIRNSSNKKVLVCIDNDKKIKEVKFSDAQKSENTILEEKNTGFFKCNIIEESVINNNNTNINFLGSLVVNNNNQLINSRRRSIDSNYTWDKLIKEGIVSENNFVLQNNQCQFISGLSNKINNVVESKSNSSSSK